MTQYYVDISHELLDTWKYEGVTNWPEGWSLVYATDHEGPWGQRWVVEDAGAPEELRNKLVTPSFTKFEDGHVEVTSRDVVDTY